MLKNDLLNIKEQYGARLGTCIYLNTALQIPIAVSEQVSPPSTGTVTPAERAQATKKKTHATIKKVSA